ncbi:MAG: hypothetical protein E7375_02855 [Clostridiales bacterium]|nr:hypothetical protein [Clostridiales bacterium]
MLKRKSIVLSDAQNESNKKAVLTMEEDGIGIKGCLRLYNFSSSLTGVSSLGFYVNQKIYKAGLTFKSNMLYEFFLDLKEIPNKFSCAVVNFQNANPTPILYGTSEGSSDEIYGEIISQMATDNSKSKAEELLDKYDVDFEEEEKIVVEKEIDEALCQNCDNCANCIYKKYFYENQSEKQEEDPSENQEEFIPEEQQVETPAFFEKLKPQIDRLFEKNPIENNLQTLIPNSKWVKIDYEDDGDFYVFGLLYSENKNVKYVCYGVPAVFEEEPPKELSGYPIWLPLNKENEKGFGYWLTYQDAITGEPIKAVID